MLCFGDTPYHHSAGNQNLGVVFNENRNEQGIIDTVRFEFSHGLEDYLEFFPQAKTTYPQLISLPEKLREGQKFTFEFLIYGSYKDDGLITPIYQEISLPTKQGISIDFVYQCVLVHESTERIYKDGKLVKVKGADAEGFPVILNLDQHEMPASLGPVSGKEEIPVGRWATWKGDPSRPFFDFVSEVFYIEAKWTHSDSIEYYEKYTMEGGMESASRLKLWPVEKLDSAVTWVNNVKTRVWLDANLAKKGLYRLSIPKEASLVNLYSGKRKENVRLRCIADYQRNMPVVVLFSKQKTERAPIGVTDGIFEFDHEHYSLFFDHTDEAFKSYKSVEAYRQYLLKKYPKMFFAKDNVIDLFNVKKENRKALLDALLTEPGINKISVCIDGLGNDVFTYFYDYVTVYTDPYKSFEENKAIIAKYGFENIQIMSGSSSYFIAYYSGKMLDRTFIQKVNELAKETRLYGVSVAYNTYVELD